MGLSGILCRPVRTTTRPRTSTTMAKMHRVVPSLTVLVAIVTTTLSSVSSFSLPSNHLRRPTVNLPHPSDAPRRSTPTSSSLGSDAAPSDTARADDVPPVVLSAADRVEECKRDLIRQCAGHELGSGYSSGVENKIRELEQLGEDAGFGQASSLSGLMSGEW